MNTTKLEERYLVGKECMIDTTDIYSLLKVEGKSYSVYLGKGDLKVKIREYPYLYDSRQMISSFHRSPRFAEIVFEAYIKGE